MSHQALIGKPAPTFTLLNYDGENFTLRPGEGGLPIALFIYPKSGTDPHCTGFGPCKSLITWQLIGSFGCTKEACQFRDAIAGEFTVLLRFSD